MEFDHDNDRITPEGGLLTIAGSGGLVVPSGTQSARQDGLGAVRFNTDNSSFEGHNGAVWLKFQTGASGVYSGQYSYGALNQMSGTTTYAYGNSEISPYSGSQVFNTTLYPASSTSKFEFVFDSFVDASSSGNHVTLGFFRGNTLLTTRTIYCGNNVTTPLSVNWIDSPGTASPVSYQLRIGVNSGTWYLGRGKNATMGGGQNGFWVIREIL